MPAIDPEFLTLSEAASLLRVGERTAYTLARSGELPAVKIGGQWRVHKPTLIRWAREGGRAPAPNVADDAA